VPERDKAVAHISADIIGAKVFDGLTQTPRGMRRDLWQGLQALVDMQFVKTVQRLDWNRVLLMASNRHHELVERHPEHSSDLIGSRLDDEDDVCPNCIVWALLSETTSGGPSGSYRNDDALKDVPVPADWWHAWLYGEDGEGPGPEEIVRKLSPLMIEAAAEIKVEAPDDE
jgi:hypothetical protein